MSGSLNNIPYDKLWTSEGEDNYLGQGGFSTVYRCYSDTHGDLAIKIMSGSGRVTEFDDEGKLHLKASVHKYILGIIGITQKRGFLGLILEYMPYGSLAEMVNDKMLDLPWSFRLRAMQETASALAFLHNYSEPKRVLHCDIKAENILLNQDLHVKISDFGGAKLASHSSLNVERSSRSQQSIKSENKKKNHYTLSHAAPEILNQFDADRTTKMDVYSFAIVLYTVTSRMKPFSGLDNDLIQLMVKQGQRPKKALDKIEEELKQQENSSNFEIFKLFCDLMTNCWDQMPQKRLAMTQVRDRLTAKFASLPEHCVDEEVLQLKKKLSPRNFGEKPKDPINVFQKYMQMKNENVTSNQNLHSSNVSMQRQVQQRSDDISDDVRVPLPLPHHRVDSPRTPQNRPENPRQQINSPQSISGSNTGVPHSIYQPLQVNESSTPTPHPRFQPAQEAVELRNKNITPESHLPNTPQHTAPNNNPEILPELELDFIDPYFRLGNPVRMISDVAAIKNAQVGHGGWNDLLLDLRDMEGRVVKVETNGDVMVSFSGLRSHRFNPSSLVKIPGGNTLKLGDAVKIELDKNLVKVMQESHGGWVDMMESLFGELGLVFRFLPDKDVLVVYKNGMHFRYNPEVLCKATETAEIREICLPDNPCIRVGDYVCHDLDEDVMKEMQETCGGWNEMMSDLRGRVGKFIYADYSGRAFVAYSSKICFVFNPAVITKLSDEEAHRRFMEYKNKSKLMMQEKTAKQVEQREKIRLKVDDIVRVHLPLDITIDLQKGHGGWSYQMLEVYGLQGIIKGFDGFNNAQVLFDSGNKWTFNPVVLQIVPEDGSRPAYMPPFRIGDRVRVNLTELPGQIRNDENKMIQLFQLLGLPQDKVEVLTKTGVVLGIDEDIDVIVCYDNNDKKKYGVKPSQLEKI